LEYSWPGNVRELENVLEAEHCVVHLQGAGGEPDPFGCGAAGRRQQEFDTFLPEGMSLDEFEQNIIKEALKRANGNKSHAAPVAWLDAECFEVSAVADGIGELAVWRISTCE